jgi:peroxiredoxin
LLTFNRNGIVAVLLSLLIGFSLAVFGQEDTSAIKFLLRSIDGGNITDADVRGKVVVFITTSSRLPARARQVASLRNLIHDYSPRGVDFYLVSTDSESRKSRRYVSDEQLRQFARELDLPLKVLRDPGGEILRKYGRDLIPLIVVLNKRRFPRREID